MFWIFLPQGNSLNIFDSQNILAAFWLDVASNSYHASRFAHWLPKVLIILLLTFENLLWTRHIMSCLHSQYNRFIPITARLILSRAEAIWLPLRMPYLPYRIRHRWGQLTDLWPGLYRILSLRKIVFHREHAGHRLLVIHIVNQEVGGIFQGYYFLSHRE